MNSSEKYMIKDLFRLTQKFSADRATIDFKTLDRKGQDTVITIRCEGQRVNSVDELYNLLTSKYNDLGTYSKVRDLGETQVSIVSNLTISREKQISKGTFGLEHRDFELEIMKELV